jgi:hypothetical protein
VCSSDLVELFSRQAFWLQEDYRRFKYLEYHLEIAS